MKRIRKDSRLRVAVVQMDCIPGDKAANLDKAAGYVRQAAGEGAKLVVLPELFTSGYRTEDTDVALAERIPGPTADALALIAREKDLVIVGCILEKAPRGVLYDTAFLVTPRGYAGKYRKIHLWKGEEKRFARGRTLKPIRTPLGTIGLQVCYDVRFPEAARTLALREATLLCYSAAFGKPRALAWDNQSRARALENGVFALYSARVGEEKDSVFNGHSRIVDPFGRVLVDLSEFVEGIATADLELSHIQRARQDVSQLADLRPEAYSLKGRRASPVKRSSLPACCKSAGTRGSRPPAAT